MGTFAEYQNCSYYILAKAFGYVLKKRRAKARPY